MHAIESHSGDPQKATRELKALVQGWEILKLGGKDTPSTFLSEEMKADQSLRSSAIFLLQFLPEMVVSRLGSPIVSSQT